MAATIPLAVNDIPKRVACRLRRAKLMPEAPMPVDKVIISASPAFYIIPAAGPAISYGALYELIVVAEGRAPAEGERFAVSAKLHFTADCAGARIPAAHPADSSGHKLVAVVANRNALSALL